MKIPVAKLETFTADKEGRAVMQAVWLDVEGQRLIATNGHIAARVTIGVDDNDITGMIPVEVFELARKELKAITKILGKDTIPDPYLRVTAGKDAVIVENLLSNTNHIVQRRKLLPNETFPNMDAVFPAINRKPNVSLTGCLLSDILKSLDGDGVSLWIDADDKAVTICSAAGKTLVVLMPRNESVDPENVTRRGLASPCDANTTHTVPPQEEVQVSIEQ